MADGAKTTAAVNRPNMTPDMLEQAYSSISMLAREPTADLDREASLQNFHSRHTLTSTGLQTQREQTTSAADLQQVYLQYPPRTSVDYLQPPPHTTVEL